MMAKLPEKTESSGGRMRRGKLKGWRKPVSFIAVFLMVFCFGSSAKAEEAVTTVSVKVTSSIVADTDEGTVSAEANSSKYRVVSAEFTNSKGSWKAGEVPKVKIELETEEGYYFSSINEGKTTIRGAVYSTVRKGSDNHSIALLVKLKPVKGTLGTVESAWWEQTPAGKARWEKSEHAPAYELKLYCGDSMVYHVDKTTSATYDFFPYMTRRGDYYFKVRAIAKTESDAEYLEPGEWTESEFQEITKRDAQAAEERNASKKTGKNTPDSAGPGWRQDRNGWWYQEADGTYPVNCWKIINNKWYLFDMNGYMLTGWQTKNGHEYYLTSNGDMVSGWFQYNRMWYYLDTQNGKTAGGWLQQGNDWYYMNPDGTMATRWIKYKGSWYYLDPVSGKMVRDQLVENYYINPDGVWNP